MDRVKGAPGRVSGGSGFQEFPDAVGRFRIEWVRLLSVVFDTPAAYSFGQCSKVLKTGGSYVATLLSVAMMTGMVRALFSSKHCRFVRVSSKRADLELVGDWLSDGLEVPIDSRHKIADLDAALKRQTNRGRIGRVVVDVSGWQL